jgi:predicted glycosyltransferase
MMQLQPPKILIVSNEIHGLGHLSIAVKICTSIQAELSDVSMLLVTASPTAHAFPLPQGLDVVKIPGLRRDSLTDYRPLRLPLAFEEVKRLRQRVIREAALAYSPDLVLIDFRPAGVSGELVSTLRALKRRQVPLVLLLRDILDDPTILRMIWKADSAAAALELYDEIWVYGCQNHYDPIVEYQFPATVARKVRFCGYLDIVSPAISGQDIRRTLGVASEPLVLVTIGNGRITPGFQVLDTYVHALACLPSEFAVFSVIVGGPELPLEQYQIIEQQCQLIATRYPQRRMHFISFSPRLLDYMAAADLVVSLGGYNTMTEILSLRKRAIVIPSMTMLKEQLIRASIMERFGLVRMIRPDRLSPEALAKSIIASLHDHPPARPRLADLGFDFGGLQRINDHVMRLLGRKAAPAISGE